VTRSLDLAKACVASFCSLTLSLSLIAVVSISTLGCEEKKNTAANNGLKTGDDPIELSATDCERLGPLPLKAQTSISRKRPRFDKFCAMVLPIDPTSLEWIESGRKRFEYRKTHPADPISHIVFFDTQANSLVAIAEVVETLIGPPEQIADLTWKRSGTDIEEILGYFGDRPVGYATEMMNFRRFRKALGLSEARAIDPNFRRPFGYVFLDHYPMLNASIAEQANPTLDAAVEF